MFKKNYTYAQLKAKKQIGMTEGQFNRQVELDALEEKIQSSAKARGDEMTFVWKPEPESNITCGHDPHSKNGSYFCFEGRQV